MGIQYSFEKTVDQTDLSDELNIVLEEKYSYIQFFINTTIYDKESGSWVLKGIDKVLSGESNYEEIGGDFFGIKVKKDNSIGYDLIAEEKDEIKESSPMSTLELRNIISEWTEAIHKFNKEKFPNQIKRDPQA
jgi:hypothetical protein